MRSFLAAGSGVGLPTGATDQVDVPASPDTLDTPMAPEWGKALPLILPALFTGGFARLPALRSILLLSHCHTLRVIGWFCGGGGGHSPTPKAPEFFLLVFR